MKDPDACKASNLRYTGFPTNAVNGSERINGVSLKRFSAPSDKSALLLLDFIIVDFDDDDDDDDRELNPNTNNGVVVVTTNSSKHPTNFCRQCCLILIK